MEHSTLPYMSDLGMRGMMRCFLIFLANNFKKSKSGPTQSATSFKKQHAVDVCFSLGTVSSCAGAVRQRKSHWSENEWRQLSWICLRCFLLWTILNYHETTIWNKMFGTCSKHRTRKIPVIWRYHSLSFCIMKPNEP